LVWLSAVPVSGAEEPPLPLSPVAVPVSVPELSDVPVSVLVELSDELSDDEVLLSLLLESLLLFDDAAASGA
jgi:hypothetical protein